MTHCKRLPEDIVIQMCRDYENGQTPLKISRKRNVSVSLIYYYLNKFGMQRIRKSVSEHVVARIINGYKAGVTLKDLAEINGVKPGTVDYIIKKNNVLPKRIHFYTDTETETMKRYYRAGKTFKEIAERTGLSRDSIYHILRRRAFKFNRNSGLSRRVIPENQAAKVIDMYEKGSSTEKIAKIYGVVKSTAARYLRKHGISIRTITECNIIRRKKIMPQIGMTKDKALLLGLLLSDGSEASKANSITLACKDKNTGHFAMDLVKKIYGINGKEYGDQGRIIWHSENMKDDLHKYVNTIVHNIPIKTNISEDIINNKTFSSAFLRGYFSCDGTVGLNVDKKGRIIRNITAFSRNIFLAEYLVRALWHLKIHHIFHNGCIAISTKEGIRAFHENIGFLPVKIQKGNRWVGNHKDMLLRTLLKTLEDDFPKRFESQQEGYVKLKAAYFTLD